jgi:hypothetical protein
MKEMMKLARMERRGGRDRFKQKQFSFCQAQSQLQPQLDLASLIISSLPASQPPGIGSNMTYQSLQIRFTKLKMEDDLIILVN